MDDLWPYLLRVRPAALFAAHLVLAALVTAHALLRKREVVSAAGWIGLAWLAPVMGAVLYLMFGINRVQRRARQLRPPGDRRDEAAAQPAPEGDGHLRPLERGIGRITGRQLLPGRVQVYRGGPRFSDRWLSLVRLTRRTDPMTGKRKRYGAEFKARVALEALRGELTAAQLAAKHGVHQTMVGEWKKQAVEGLAAVFSGKEAARDTARLSEAEVEKLHAKIGQLVVERDFLAKASGR